MDLNRYNYYSDMPLNTTQWLIVNMTVKFLRGLEPGTDFKWVFTSEYQGFPNGMEKSNGIHPLPRNTQNWSEEECWDLEFAIEEAAVTLDINEPSGEDSGGDEDEDSGDDGDEDNDGDEDEDTDRSVVTDSSWLRAAFDELLHDDLVVYMLNRLMDTIKNGTGHDIILTRGFNPLMDTSCGPNWFKWQFTIDYTEFPKDQLLRFSLDEMAWLNHAITERHIYILARLDWLSETAFKSIPNYSFANMKGAEAYRPSKTIAQEKLVEDVETKLKEVCGEKFPVAGDLWPKMWWKFLKGDGSEELWEEYFWVFSPTYPSFQCADVPDWRPAELKRLLRALYFGEVSLKKIVWIPGLQSWA